jgi:hypothetical protein
MLGLVSRILRDFGGGFVLTETGDEVSFGPYALDEIGIEELRRASGSNSNSMNLRWGGRLLHVSVPKVLCD